MNETLEKPVIRKPRRIFGRREFEHAGLRYRLELRTAGLVLWRKGSPKKKTIPLGEVIELAGGQRFLL